MGAFQMPQPAETLKCCFPFRCWRFDSEGRQSPGFDETTSQRKAAMIKFLRQLRVSNAQIGWCDQDTIRGKAGEAPAIKRPHAQTAAEFAPGLCNGQSPQVWGFAEGDCHPVFLHIVCHYCLARSNSRFPLIQLY